jgi:hypothetical protein
MDNYNWQHSKLYTEAREASLSHPPHSEHLVSSPKKGSLLGLTGTSGKKQTPALFEHLKAYRHFILTSYFHAIGFFF